GPSGCRRRGSGPQGTQERGAGRGGRGGAGRTTSCGRTAWRGCVSLGVSVLGLVLSSHPNRRGTSERTQFGQKNSAALPAGVQRQQPSEDLRGPAVPESPFAAFVARIRAGDESAAAELV